ncbi:MAG: MFS transporter [Paracoccaceae bacterium]
MARQLPVVEFVALMALLFSMVAFAIDAMLPGLPDIAQELTQADPNKAQLVVTAFMLGMGVGTFFAGPLADAYGRRFITNIGLFIFVLGSFLAYIAPSLELMLGARLFQGLGVAGARIAPLAMIRDLYEGRQMARITSFVTMVFMLVPAVAPSLGAVIINQWNWRAIFIAFILFAAVGFVWLNARQSETLAVPDRRPLRYGLLKAGIVEIATNPQVVLHTAIMSLGFATLVAQLSSTLQIYAETFDRLASFPVWFGLTALLAMPATILNAMLVVRVGMRQMVRFAFAIQSVVSVAVVLLFLQSGQPIIALFPLWFFWSAVNLWTVGLTLGNLQALALGPLGHIAGLGASVTIAVSTIIAVVIGGAVGLAFNGTPIPLIISVALLSVMALVLTWLSTGETKS